MPEETNEVVARLRQVIEAWSTITELSSFARKRHGFGDSNGGFGVTYPGDLDEYQKTIERENIPEGMVQVYGFWGPPHGYEFLVSESLYLTVLATLLREKGYSDEAASITV